MILYTSHSKNDFFNLGPFGFYELKINVCVKQRSNNERYVNRQTSFEDRLLETAEWPPGNYCCLPGKTKCVRMVGMIKLR